MSNRKDVQDTAELMALGLKQAGISPLQYFSSFDSEEDEWRDPEVELEAELIELYEDKYSEEVIKEVADLLEADYGAWGRES
jgi:hypothetical protein